MENKVVIKTLISSQHQKLWSHLDAWLTIKFPSSKNVAMHIRTVKQLIYDKSPDWAVYELWTGGVTELLNYATLKKKKKRKQNHGEALLEFRTVPLAWRSNSTSDSLIDLSAAAASGSRRHGN